MRDDLQLGALETRVMELLWTEPAGASGRQVLARLGARPRLAYTTIQTTLDRLYRKRMLRRVREGRAHRYYAAMSRDDYQRMATREALSPLLQDNPQTVLAAFVEVAAELDEASLDELEALIAAKREGGK